ncbi:hypothetical protein T265_11701 [Opisthorchis viverrini]|uniref:Uncharacterized protein n=1 Tax=Opisthorchis viverrini TaxID=6198 RepID=A0A074YXP2_OPIVI|nr:hypothetical protein T265_11701 [Opisthorchis viverrini]KER19566.1 hypothetical protein T265_11701 [Opisthorchis viverrini]
MWNKSKKELNECEGPLVKVRTAGTCFLRSLAATYSLLDREAKLSFASCLQKRNIRLLLERVSLNFPGYSLTVAQLQANTTPHISNLRVGYYGYRCITISRKSCRLEHETACYSTFSCLKKSQPKDSAWFQLSLS